jgi:hypothetical protein
MIAALLAAVLLGSCGSGPHETPCVRCPGDPSCPAPKPPAPVCAVKIYGRCVQGETGSRVTVSSCVCDAYECHDIPGAKERCTVKVEKAKP